MEWAFVAVVVLAREKLLRRPMRQIARREDMRNRRACLPRLAPALGKVRLHESAMLPREVAERMQRLDDARALRPAAAGAGGEGDHGQLTFLKRGQPCRSEI